MDNGALTCEILDGSTVISKTCVTTQTSSVVNTLQINNICSTSACTATASYILRIKNVVNRLSVTPFIGTMLIESRIDSSTLVGSISHALSGVTTLSPGQFTPTVIRSVSTQGLAATFKLSWAIPGFLIDDSTVEIRLPID